MPQQAADFARAARLVLTSPFERGEGAAVPRLELLSGQEDMRQGSDGWHGLGHSLDMCRRQLLLGLIMLVGLAQPSAAQAPPQHYQLPCRTPAAFAARVRGLVRDPDGVERALAQFSIVAAPDAPDAADTRWTLRVSRLDRAGSDPRSVREASCERAADAAALVVSAWMDEDPFAASGGEARARGLPAEHPELGTLPLIGQGVSLVADTATALGPSFRPGVSVELWNRSTGEVTLQALGFSLWPGAVAEQSSPRNDRYARPFAEFSLHQGGYLVGRNYFRAGALFSAYFGVKQLEPRHYAPTLRLSLAAMVQCDIGIWSIFYRIGFSGMADAAVKISLVSSLGVGVMLF